MNEFTSMAKVESYDECFLLKIAKEEQFHDLLHRLGDGCKVKVTIQYEDPRQDWIDKWYSKAVDAAGESVIFKFVKDGIVCIPVFDPENTKVAAPRKGDKYDRKTGMAVAFAKTCYMKIPEYI